MLTRQRRLLQLQELLRQQLLQPQRWQQRRAAADAAVGDVAAADDAADDAAEDAAEDVVTLQSLLRSRQILSSQRILFPATASLTVGHTLF